MGRKEKLSGKLVITQQEMVLIKASNEVEDTERYGNLYSCLEGYKNLSRAELDSNIVFDDKARTVLTSSENKKVMMDNIVKEWYSAKNFDVADREVKCQLCGRVNKFIFYIHNKVTEKDLHIGSDCVTKFPDITGISQQRKSLSKLKDEQGRQKRKIEFEIREKEDVEFIPKSDARFKDFPVLLSFNLYNEIKDTIEQLRLTKASYIKSGGDLDKVFEKYGILKGKLQELFLKAEEHYERVKNNMLACNKDVSNWLYENYHSAWEKVAKNGGVFNVDTLKCVSYDKYLIEKLGIIRRHILDKDINIIDVDKTVIKFVIDNNRYRVPIIFSMPVKKFMATVGCYCITDKQYGFGKADLQDITIELTKSNFEALYNSVLSILNRNGYDFIIEDKTEQAYWKKLSDRERKGRWHNKGVQGSPMYKKSSIKIFMDTLAPFLLKDEVVLEKNFEIVIKRMEMGQRWISQNEKKVYDEAAQYARGMQRQRAFTPY